MYQLSEFIVTFKTSKNQFIKFLAMYQVNIWTEFYWNNTLNEIFNKNTCKSAYKSAYKINAISDWHLCKRNHLANNSRYIHTL